MRRFFLATLPAGRLEYLGIFVICTLSIELIGYAYNPLKTYAEEYYLLAVFAYVLVVTLLCWLWAVNILRRLEDLEAGWKGKVMVICTLVTAGLGFEFTINSVLDNMSGAALVVAVVGLMVIRITAGAMGFVMLVARGRLAKAKKQLKKAAKEAPIAGDLQPARAS